MPFVGDVGLVSGGAEGLGAATVRRLHGAGAAVLIADVADDKGAALADEFGNGAAYVHTDVLNDNTVAPGTIRTPPMELAPAEFAETVPFPKRLGRPDEYASLAQHLLENTDINCEVVRVDGVQRFQPR